MNWLSATPTLIAARPEISHDLPLITWLGPAISEIGRATSACPDLPPPERA